MKEGDTERGVKLRGRIGGMVERKKIQRAREKPLGVLTRS
jgi:hypothetical protein